MVTRRIQIAILTLTRACKCKLWANKLLETSGIKLNFVLENVYDEPKLQTTKQSSALPMAARWQPVRWGSKWATASTASESQFRQCRNCVLLHSLLSPWLWWVQCFFYDIPQGTQDIPHGKSPHSTEHPYGTQDIPSHLSWYPPRYWTLARGTQDTPLRYWALSCYLRLYCHHDNL